jgi:glycosyltransferase involved in cell wall biosynthesis
VGSKRPRVVVLWEDGAEDEARLRKTAQTLSRAGAGVSVLVASALRGRCVGLLALDRRHSPRVTGSYRLDLAARLRGLEPDAIHVHGVRALDAVAASFDKVRFTRTLAGENRPAIVYDACDHVPGRRTRQGRAQRDLAERPALGQSRIGVADAVMASSSEIATRLHCEHGLSELPTVVHDAPLLDRPGVSSRALRADAGVERDTPLLIWSGTAGCGDGLEMVVEALPFLPGVHLAVVAQPKLQIGRLLEAARQWDVADRLHVVPPVSGAELPAYIGAADLAVIPTSGSSGGDELALPSVLFEYLHAGVPIVTSDLQAPSAFVMAHALGAVFRRGDPVALALAVRQVLTPSSPRLSPALRHTHSWEAQESRLLGVYASLADRWPRLRGLDHAGAATARG